MIFERFRRRRTAAPTQLSCYGKLPFHREFLRFNLDGNDSRWLVSLVDGAHQVLAAQAAGNGMHDTEIRAVLARAGGRSAVAALIRPSVDGGARTYPISLFASCDAQDFRDSWHLTTLWLAPLWQAMRRNLLDVSFTDRGAFAAALGAAAWTPDSVELSGQRFQAAMEAPVPSPWLALTGTESSRAEQLAATFVHLGEVQRRAQGSTDGVALRIPVSPAAALGFGGDAAMMAAAWARLFAAVSGCSGCLAAIVEVGPLNTTLPESICIFGREPTALDIAQLIAGVGDAPIDRIDEPWPTNKPSERAAHLIAQLLDEQARCVADLWHA